MMRLKTQRVRMVPPIPHTIIVTKVKLSVTPNVKLSMAFLALRVTVYNSTLEEAVWVGIGSTIMRATVPSHTMIPAGSVVRSSHDVRNYRLTNEKEIEYQKNVFKASAALREGYKKFFGAGKSK
jgi:acetyltransferase-like isoleucine patch superfamily enzyme